MYYVQDSEAAKHSELIPFAHLFFFWGMCETLPVPSSFADCGVMLLYESNPSLFTVGNLGLKTNLFGSLLLLTFFGKSWVLFF